MISKEIVETIIIRGLQNFDKFEILNSVEIKIEGGKILNKLKLSERKLRI